MSDDSFIFWSTYDRVGRKVELSGSVFTNKILPKHKELSPELIKEAVEKSHYITSDPNYPKRSRYYKIMTHPVNDVSHLTHLKVVAHHDENEYGKVITAYILTSLKNESDQGALIYDAGQD